MMLIPLAARVFCALATLLTTGDRGASQQRVSLTAPSDTVAEAMIVSELRAFYRDLDDKNWTTLITHFLPAKVTARFAAPESNEVWASLAPPPWDPGVTADAAGHCAPRAAVAVVGSWARVRARRCTGAVDEAWFYFMSGHWKIIHLIFGPPTAA